VARLILHTIEVQNFGSWRSGTVTLNGAGPVAVTGLNGTGKSTLFSKALCWALYGKASPERMGSGTRALGGKDLVRDTAASSDRAEVSVSLSLEPGGPPMYRVTRSRRRSGDERLTVETVAGPEKGTCTYEQESVDLLVGAPYEVFIRTVLRGQGDVWNFAEAPDSRKREILDAISGATLLVEKYDAAKARQRELTSSVRLATLVADQAAARVESSSLGPMRTRADDWDVDHAARVEAVEAEVAAYADELEVIRAEQEAAAATAARRADIEAAKPTLDLAPYHEAIATATGVLARVEATYRACMDEEAQYHAMGLGTTCPMCGQEVTQSMADKRVAANAATYEATAAVTEASQSLSEAKDARRKAEAWLADQIKTWREQLAAFPAPPSRTTAQAATALAEASKRLQAVKDATNPWKEALAGAEATLDTNQRQKAAAEEYVALLRADEAALEVLVEAYSPKGARASLGKGALAAIDSAANRWLGHISGGTMTCEFSPERVTQAGTRRAEIVTSVTVGGRKRDLLQLSGGQRVRVNFAVDLGVAACFARGGALALSLLVLDEAVFSNLDEHGKFAMVQAIHHAGVADVVVIDHDPKISDSFHRAIHVTADEDGSKIETP